MLITSSKKKIHLNIHNIDCKSYIRYIRYLGIYLNEHLQLEFQIQHVVILIESAYGGKPASFRNAHHVFAQRSVSHPVKWKRGPPWWRVVCARFACFQLMRFPVNWRFEFAEHWDQTRLFIIKNHPKSWNIQRLSNKHGRLTSSFTIFHWPHVALRPRREPFTKWGGSPRTTE